MCIKQKIAKSRGKTGVARTEHDKACAPREPWEHAFRLWRTVPADGFGPAQRAAVVECVQRTSSTIGIWRAAIRGDAPSAIRLFLKSRSPSQITARTDLMMTALLNCALNGSAGAALVLSHALRRMPLDRVLKRRLATSWLANNLRLALPGLDRLVIARRRARRPVALRIGTEEHS
jgi:hypothetical protein